MDSLKTLFSVIGNLELKISKIMTTSEVVEWFVDRAANLKVARANGTKKFQMICESTNQKVNSLIEEKTLVPAATNSVAPMSIGGAIGSAVAITSDNNWDGNTYEWFDLAYVPVGEYVYRISVKNTLHVFRHDSISDIGPEHDSWSYFAVKLVPRKVQNEESTE